jgi:uracil-DNA glycosylase family 4
MPTLPTLLQLERNVPKCLHCSDLREYCAEVARAKRRAYADQVYWGRPVPGFGDHAARIWIIGLAPAAHGANRTGRMFTGDRSGDFLYAGLHRAGLASQAEATARDDGLELSDVYISAACRCAPPANKPTRDQLAACSEYLDIELQRLRRLRVVFCLGGIALNAAIEMLRRAGHDVPRPKPKFAHMGRWTIGGLHVLSCYHVSQQNTFTGRLTPAMLDEVLILAQQLSTQ